jgi:glycosyltransferase involved in cell wall biosynthesis
MAPPRVSAVVCAYNAESSVARAINSILAQDFCDSEVIVVDDGSTDGTPEILHGYGERIRVVRQENRGLPAARNAGVAASKAEYIAFLDADDLWLPGRLEKTVAALDREPSAVLAYTDAALVDCSDRPLGPHVPEEKAHAPSFEELMKGWWPSLPSAFLVRRRSYQACGGFCEGFKGPGGFDDIFFLLTIREKGPFVYVPEQLIRRQQLPFVGRMEKYAAGFRVFAHCMRERYGAAGDASVQDRADAHYRALNVAGLQAMAEGRLKDARRALRCAMRYRRPNRRHVFRLLRTYLPRPLAVALSNRKRASAIVPK